MRKTENFSSSSRSLFWVQYFSGKMNEKEIRILHCGNGGQGNEVFAHFFPSIKINSTTLDANPDCKPDIVSSVINIPLEECTFDCVFASHLIEHLYIYEVEKALNEFYRVLKNKGFLIISCPDLEVIAKAILDIGAESVLYNSPAGPISPVQMLWGHSNSIRNGNLFMSHKYGFTGKTLTQFLQRAGFVNIKIEAKNFQIQAFALKP
jgi:predicted SAM-dependent methyltransferase